MLIVLGSFIALDLLIVGLIFVPPIQEKVVGIVTEKLSEKWNSKITIGHIYLSPTLEITAEDFVIHDSHNNPMIAAGKLKSRVTQLNTKPFQLGLGTIESDKIKVIVRKYKGDDAVNISLWAKNFQKKEKSPQPFQFSSSSIILKNAYFLYANDTVRTTNDKGDLDVGYFELKNIDAQLDNFKLVGSDITANIDHIALEQYTGFKLLGLSGKFHIGPTGLSIDNATVATPSSRIFMDFAFVYNSWKDYGDFLNKINFKVKAKTSTVNMHDICFFAPQTKGMDNELVFAAEVNGPINHLSIKDLDAHFADNTHLAGDILLNGVTDFFNADITAKLNQSTVDLAELQTFKLPHGKCIELPDNVTNLGLMTVDLEYDGIISDNFDLMADIESDMGDIQAALSADFPDDNDGLIYDATVTAQNLTLAKLFPKVNMVGGITGKVAAKGSVGDVNNFASTLTANATANISRIYLKGYPLQHFQAQGRYRNKKIDADIALNDPNLQMACDGVIDLSHPLSEYSATANIGKIDFTRLFAHLPLMDSTTTDGFEKLVRYVQLHPTMSVAVGNLACDLRGNELRNMNGNVFIDSITYTQDGNNLAMDRIRLVSLANDNRQLLKLSSDLLSVSLSTSYNATDIPSALIDMVYTYCGNLLPERKTIPEPYTAGMPDDDLELNVSAYKLQPVLNMFVPNIQLADNTMVKISTNRSHSNDDIQISSPEINVGEKLKIKNIQISSQQSDTAKMALAASVQSLLIGSQGNFAFDDIALKTDMEAQHLQYQLNWKNPAIISSHRSVLAGTVDFADNGDIKTKVTESEVYFKELPFSFNQDHLVTVSKGSVHIDNVILSSLESQAVVNGHIGKEGDSLVATIDNMDVSVVNQFIKTDKMSLEGALSANVQIRELRGNDMLLGTVIIKDFEFNDEPFGYLYANAILPSDKNIHFRGGLINAEDFPEDATVFNYTYNNNFKNQKGVNTHLNGLYDSDAGKLKVTADIDTLPLGFLEPILSSFSHKFEGNASGKIDFVLDADSMYFDGQATVREAQIGIAPLNTFYNLTNQKIDFTKEGFTFDHVDLTDQFGNHATMNGYVNHDKFSDFDINLQISTPKIFVLNTKQEQDSPFYGDGFVSGNIAIVGNTEKLSFSGYDLVTQSGTVFCLPISFADKVYDSDVISFVVTHDENEETTEEEQPESDMEMDFDFKFFVTPAADIKLDLDLSAFGGKIKTKGEGELSFQYNTKKDKIDMKGDVVLQSGTFIMTFAQLLNKKFELVTGGVVSFPGSLYDININVRAAYSTTASLADLFDSEATNIRRMPVKAYLDFNGNLNDPAAINFAFDLPNATSDLKTLFYSTIDTTSIQKKTEQFFSLVMLGKFASSQTSIANINIENTGIGVLTNTLSDFISNQLKYVDVNFNYQNATADKAAEYTVGASTSLFNDRTVIETYFGYKDDANASSLSNQFVGDFSVEQKLNELGTWRLKVFNVTNQDELRNATRNNPYAQGIAIIYKQDFNNRKDLAESFKRSKKKDKKNKKSKDQPQKTDEAIIFDDKSAKK